MDNKKFAIIPDIENILLHIAGPLIIYNLSNDFQHQCNAIAWRAGIGPLLGLVINGVFQTHEKEIIEVLTLGGIQYYWHDNEKDAIAYYNMMNYE